MAEVIILDRPTDAGRHVAGHIARLTLAVPTAVLGVATGSTPLPVYNQLRALALAGSVNFRNTTLFALDEYVGLPQTHPESYHSVIRRELVEPLGLDPQRVHIPDGELERIDDAGARFESLIHSAGGIDLQLLGIGSDGHIGFNEPGSSLASFTRMKTLTERTRLDNARFFSSADEVPRHCITQGLGTILRARHLVLLATGRGKASAIAAALEGPVTAQCPASIIQLHPKATVVMDISAAAELRNSAYYRYAWTNKPRQAPEYLKDGDLPGTRK